MERTLMEERAHGIILRTRPLTETSLIVQWLTPELGRIATVAKGARRPKSAFTGKLDLYYDAEFSFQRARKSSLHTLREVSVRTTHSYLRTDIAALQLAARASRRIERVTEEETPLPEIHELFANFLAELSKPPLTETLALAFEARLLVEIGSALEAEAAPVSAGARKILEQLLTMDWAHLRNLKLTSAQSSELARYLDRALAQSVA